jgi:DNA modification methylase
MKVSQLKTNASNPRQIKGEKLDKLKASIAGFQKMMELRPMIVDENNTVLGGNMRLAAIKAMGMKDIPDEWVRFAADLTEDEKAQFIITDNSSFGEYDWDTIANEWSDYPLADWGLDVPDFEAVDEGEPKDAEPQIDKAAELNKKWQVKAGDLWQIGSHRLICGDSTNAQDVSRLLDGAKAQMVLTDPPYGMNLDTDWSDAVGSMKSIGRQHQTTGNKYDKVIGDDTPFDPSHIFAFFGDCDEIFLWGADYYAESIPNRTDGSWIVWDKRKESQAEAIGSEFELCWSKAKHKRRMLRHDWFGFLSSGNTKEARNRVHPNQKPTTLLQDIIEQWGKDAEIIADLYAGSGTTLVACQNLNRKCYAIEISENYCAVILERMQTAFPELEIKRVEGAKEANA